MKRKLSIILIVVFSILGSFLSIYPIINTKSDAALFNFEPDVPYVANAILYIYTNKIYYSAHPATPSIVTLSYSMLPLRIYAKYVDKIPFYTWTIRNQNFLYTYERFFISVIFGFGLFFFLYTIFTIRNSIKFVTLSYLGLFTFNNTPYLGIIIQSEPFSFLIISVWFYLFSRFVRNQSLNLYLIICFISGLVLANKLPNLFFVFCSLNLFIFLKSKSFKNSLVNLLLGLVFVISSFLLFTIPIHEQYPALWSWVVHLSTHSGVHGRGQAEFLNFSNQIKNLYTLFEIEKNSAILAIGVIITWFINIKNKLKKIIIPQNILFFWMIIGILIFSKFPLSHYQQFHFIGLIISFVYTEIKINRISFTTIIIVLIGMSFSSINNYWKTNITEVMKYKSLESFIRNNPPSKGTVWEWGRSSDYSLLHTRDWICNPYAFYFSEERPRLFSLTTNLQEVVQSCGNKAKLFEVCWDHLYIQESEMKRFFNLYDSSIFSVIKIVDSKDMWLIVSNHCTNDKN